ncbi:MAG TPA: ribosome maturation factor RimM [Anaerolineales bacterium]|nr:ribosome maturation factor RimM [Anaerolineales bacterium]
MTSRKAPESAGSGSPSAGEPEYLVVGSLRRAHGVRGEMVMEVLTDFPERLMPGTKVFVGPSHRSMVIAGTRSHSEGLLIKFDHVDNPEEAGRCRNQMVYVTTSDRPPLPEGQYYEHQVIGFSVIDDDSGVSIGSLSGIMRTGANDIYVVARPGGGEVLLPVIASVVLSIDAQSRTIHVHLLPGLVEDAET